LANLALPAPPCIRLNLYSPYYAYRDELIMEKLVERELIVPVRFSKREIERVDKAVERGGAKSRSALIREATQKYLQELGSLKVIEIRNGITLKHAKAEILTYLHEHKEAETFDIANDLRLDLELTVKALKKLWEEGRVA
jgi:Arc/MetJ-type ribon-helix-helix transcriptional regulator